MKLFIVLLLLVSAHAWASEISLLQKDLVLPKKTAGQVQKRKIEPAKQNPPKQNILMETQKHQETDFNQMQDFMRQENERIKAIKILNLDLEREDLELKKKEIEAKLAALDKNSPAVPMPSALPGNTQPVFKLAGIFLDGPDKDILMSIDGVTVQAKEGEHLQGGMVVKKIGTDSAVLEHSDGKIETINLGS